MPSAAATNAIGAIGGGLLAACLAPQLWKLYATRSARDLSYLFLALYCAGCLLTFVYLYYEDATVAWICILIEVGFSALMIIAKYYLDNWGPNSWRAAKKARPESKLTNSPSLAKEIKIDIAEFGAGSAAPFPLLKPAPSHAAQHLLLDVKLALPAGTAGAAGAAGTAGMVNGAATGGRQRNGGGSSGSVLDTVAEMMEAALVAAGLPAQRRQTGSFPSFRRRPSQADTQDSPQQRQPGDQRAGPEEQPQKGVSKANLLDSGTDDEESGSAVPDMFFLSCRDGYAVAIYYPDTTTLSVDLLAASEPAILRMGAAGAQLCKQLVAEWPGSRIAANTVSRLPHAAQLLVTRAEREVRLGGEQLTAAAARPAAVPVGEALIGDKAPSSAGGATSSASSVGRPGTSSVPGSSGYVSDSGTTTTTTISISTGRLGGGGGEGAPSASFPTGHIGVSDDEGKRSHMEDRHTVIPNFSIKGADPSLPRQFVAVYDGHSSHRGSEHAARRVHQYIAAQPAVQQCKGDSCDVSAIEAALKEAFEDVDQEIVETAVNHGKRYGTTAVCALRIGNTLYVAHAGDSRAILCREGRAITLTRDHKPASVPEERERIEAQGGRIAYEADRVLSNPEGQRQSRLNMSRALGDPDFKQPRRLVEAEPDVARVELKAGADRFLLLGSDGLFEVLSNQQAVEIALAALQTTGGGKASEAAAQAAADALVAQALKAGTRDNVTALVQAFEW
ncbi:integrin-linked kinase-associated serine threonine phosphatase 2C [Chlorella sorokiniana]|uniref:Integrin-linked kinase-associated serine threonine phosphatase 2C n=1 Tax=Chlorella sorokiniana TaxID=3076 RepID=A0A2P6TZA8_CHLSO|nr:integrin-linked kinase-associated serine threonine phosphatase 2C [Chlorella sorokiniana]|eukprot:PRW59402.1 integrin-linked kinase-associated serine threonine phosphatase 2C [Chlorella sorokiniana]